MQNASNQRLEVGTTWERGWGLSPSHRSFCYNYVLRTISYIVWSAVHVLTVYHTTMAIHAVTTGNSELSNRSYLRAATI